MNKPESYYRGISDFKQGLQRKDNPYIWLGPKYRGHETWWYTGWDKESRKSGDKTK